MIALQHEVVHKPSTEDLTAAIARWVQQRTHWQVWNLKVLVQSGVVCLTGRCKSYYSKQLALEGALDACADLESLATAQVSNEIEVTKPRLSPLAAAE